MILEGKITFDTSQILQNKSLGAGGNPNIIKPEKKQPRIIISAISSFLLVLIKLHQYKQAKLTLLLANYLEHRMYYFP